MRLFAAPKLAVLRQNSFFYRHTFIIALGLSLLSAIVIARWYQSKAIVAWDEAYFIEWVFWNASAITSNDWNTFFELARASNQYPAFFSWILAIPMVLSKPSIELARLTNLVFYVVCALLLYPISSLINSRRKRLCALLSVIVFLISPMSMTYGAIALREMMGTMFTLFLVLFYILSLKRSAFFLPFVSLSLVLVSMVKYNFGVILFAPLLLSEGMEWIISRAKAVTFSRVLIIFIPYLLYMYWYIVVFLNDPGKFMATLQNKANYLTGMGTKLDHFLFYPRGIIYLYSPSVVLGILVLAAFVIAIRYYKMSVIRFMWIAVALNILLGIIHTENMQERYIFTVMPFMYVIAVFTANNLYSEVSSRLPSKRGKIFMRCVFAVLVVIIGWELTALPGYVYTVGSFTNKVGQYNEIGFKDYWFNYNRKDWEFPLPEKNDESPKALFEYVASVVDVRKPVHFIGEANELSQPYRNLIFHQFIRENRTPVGDYSEAAVITDMSPASKYYTRDYKIQHEWKMGNRYLIEDNSLWKYLTEKNYDQLGVKLTIYTKD